MKIGFSRLQVYRNPNIGVYIYVNNKIAIVPPGLSKLAKKTITEILNVDIIESTIAGSRINGVFLAGNDKAILAPEIIKDDELQFLRDSLGKSIRIVIIKTKNTALGNLIVANNNACLVSPVLEEGAVKKIEDALGVRVKKKALLGIPTVGSMMVVNDYKALVHPLVADDEIEEINKHLNINAGPATVNEGVSFVKTGVLLNNNGVLVGESTTGPEIMNIHALLS